jgi:hypothetical protein
MGFSPVFSSFCPHLESHETGFCSPQFCQHPVLLSLYQRHLQHFNLFSSQFLQTLPNSSPKPILKVSQPLGQVKSQQQCYFSVPIFYINQDFHCYDKYLRETIWKGKGFILTLSFRGFSPCCITPLLLGPCIMRQNIMVAEACGRAKSLTSWQTGGKERGEWPGQDTAPRTFPQWSPSSSHAPLPQLPYDAFKLSPLVE